MERKRNLQPVLTALLAFEEAAKASSFTAAARELGMAQPSVSRFIGILETQLGVELFVRQHNRVVLTEPGERLYRAASLGLGHIRSVVEQLKAEAGHACLTITCTHGFAHMWVLPRLDNLKSLLPGYDVRVTSSDEMPVELPVAGELGIRFGRGEWPDVIAIPLFDEVVFPVCSPGYAQEHGLSQNPPVPDDLTGLALLAQDQEDFEWLGWQAWFGATGTVSSQVQIETIARNYNFVLQAAMEGKGIALAWDHLIEPYLSNGWLVALQGMNVSTDKGYYLVMSPDQAVERAVEEWIGNTA